MNLLLFIIVFIIVYTQSAEQAIHHNENEKKPNTNYIETNIAY